MPTEGRYIITSGEKFTDIDALACAVSYHELLSLQGKEAIAFMPGELNKSITKFVKSWNPQYSTEYKSRGGDQVIIVDLSIPEQIPAQIDHNQIVELVDHHFDGFEEYWREKLGDKAIIELIGAAATLIWEKYVQVGFAEEISTVSANLLATAIVSNTLNFNATLCNKRDINAYEQLSKHTDLPINWVPQYFQEQEEDLYKNMESIIRNDTKLIPTSPIGKTLVIGQMELWNSKQFINENIALIETILSSYHNKNWFMTAPSISEGINYLLTNNREIQALLTKTIDATFEGNIGTTNKLWLRKEILNEMRKHVQ